MPQRVVVSFTLLQCSARFVELDLELLNVALALLHRSGDIIQIASARSVDLFQSL